MPPALTAAGAAVGVEVEADGVGFTHERRDGLGVGQIRHKSLGEGLDRLLTAAGEEDAGLGAQTLHLGRLAPLDEPECDALPEASHAGMAQTPDGAGGRRVTRVKDQ